MLNNENKLTETLGKKMTNVASFIVAGKSISLIINLVTFIIIARYLGPSAFGIYTIIMSITALFGGFGNPNINSYISERIPKLISAKKTSEAKLVLGDTLFITIIFGIILTILVLVFSPSFSVYSLHNINYFFLLDIASVTILLALIYATLYYHILSLNKGGSLATSSIIHASIQGIFGVGLVLLGFGILGAILGFIFGLIVASLFEFYVLLKHLGFNFKLEGIFSRVKKILLFSKDMAYSNIISASISNFSVIFLALIVSSSLVGYYGIASRVGSLIDVFIGAISLAVLPMFSEAIYKEKQGANAGKLLYFSTYISLIFTTPLIIFLSVFSGEIIYIAFNTAYLGATQYMQLISIGILIGIFGSYGANFLITSSKQNKILKYTAISVLLQFIFLFILTPYFGVIGMIIATFYIGNISLSILYLNYFSKIGINMHRGKLLRLLTANFLFAFLLIPISLIFSGAIGLLIGVAAMFLLYPIFLGVMKALTNNDILVIKTVSESVPIFGKIIVSIANYASKFCS